ncbi:universal stress protein [Mitsuaria sp. CC2]|uniref:universal stress protein n=1 Tax=Mitsuaria sp. CC2 TaxID=3029186 RepID=UPI003B8D0711
MYDSILVLIDGSHASDAGFAYALGLASALKARIVLLNVIDVEPLFLQSAGDFEDHRRTLREYGQELLATAAVAAQDRGVQVSYYMHETVESNAASIIVAEAVAQHCGLIVLGTHGRRRLSKLLLGSDAELVLRDSTVPVLFVRSPRPDQAAPQVRTEWSSERTATAA